MARGNQGQAVFRDDRDRKRFLATLGEACGKTGWIVDAYVLMGNHYHLLVQTPEGNLVAGMKWLQGTYTQRFNRRHGVLGHLFQGRYKAVVVEAEKAGYWEVVSTYIHLNPARAGLIQPGKEPLGAYPWSSYPFYAGRAKRGPIWLRRERVMGSLGLGEGDGRGYAAYLEGRVLELGLKAGRQELEAKWRQLRRGWYAGGKDFADSLREELGRAARGWRRDSQSGGARRFHDEQWAERRVRAGLGALGLAEEDLARMRKGAPEKMALAGWLREGTTATLEWVSGRLGMGHPGNVSQGSRKLGPGDCRRFEAALTEIAALAPERGKYVIPRTDPLS
jgi:REP element-mobilizing transposase RayT